MNRKNVYTVTQVNSYIKNMFAQDFLLRTLCVKGEVSNCKYHSSGHIYFTLKDDKGTISCVMFAGNRGGLTFPMKEGNQVIVLGSVEVYERDGKYQLYAKQILADGAGLLAERFEALKRELEERGMFAPEYKLPIPKYCKTLGVITAPTGAAVRDIINISTRRNPYIQILLYPAIVQGENAAASLIRGIHAMEAIGVDVIILGRGGGSLEDLWAFNEEEVAQAVFDCSIPIISAVGHETDTALTDYVADLRAPTPSAAAELAVYDIRELDEHLEGYRRLLIRCMDNRLEKVRYYLKNRELHLQKISPENQLRTHRMTLLHREEALQKAMATALERQKHRIALYAQQLKRLSPMEKLSKGYSLVTDMNQHSVHSVEDVEEEAFLQIHLKDGRLRVQVKEKEKLELWGKAGQ